MTAWSKDELRKIAETNDLHISPLREDGVTYGTRRGSGPSLSATIFAIAAELAEQFLQA
jgi:hypothetical protein